MVDDFRRRLVAIRDALYRLGRQTALLSLIEPTWKSKAEQADRVVLLFEAASEVGEFLERYYGEMPFVVRWPQDWDGADVGLVHQGTVERPETERAIRDLAGAVAAMNGAVSATANHRLLGPERDLAERVGAILPSSSGHELPLDPEHWRSRLMAPTQVIRGPKAIGLDPAFQPIVSLVEELPPVFGDRLEDAVPYFWNLSVREATAADLCLLSLFEYDGFPLAFYRDMAKQAQDEARHALYFLEEARRMLPELKATLSAENPLAQHLESSELLPIPAEGRLLYEAIWNMDLVERLILMHHDTETPAIPKLAEWIDSDFCRRYPEVADAFRVIRRDEISHSQIGNLWLRRLLPDPDDRRAAFGRARLLRGFFLLTAVRHHSDESLETLALDASRSRLKRA